MHVDDQKKFIQRYTQRFEKFGRSPATLGWGKGGRQEWRFSALTRPLRSQLKASVLDVGCGFADLYAYLLALGWQGEYSGIELVPTIFDETQKRYPHVNLYCGSFQEFFKTNSQKYDYIIASGLFNARLFEEDNLAYMESSIVEMLKHTNQALCLDFMSTYVDFQHPDAWHTDPLWLIAMIRKYSIRFELFYDYMPYEFTLVLYSDDHKTTHNVFEGYEMTKDG